jgi:hypothetical protein
MYNKTGHTEKPKKCCAWILEHAIFSFGNMPVMAWARYQLKQWHCGPDSFYFSSPVFVFFFTTVNWGCKYISLGSTRKNRKECSDGAEWYGDHSDLRRPCPKRNTFTKEQQAHFPRRRKLPSLTFIPRTSRHIRVCYFIRVFPSL